MMMPKQMNPRASDPASLESLCGEGVPLNGVDDQADRRAHMRAQTTARQAAERRLSYPPIPMGSPDRQMRKAERMARMHEELSLIDAEHQAWLDARADRP